ncbi:MAG: cytochrome [Bacteroidetes bacterium]|jgi:cytochrome c5|nr:cytochrome [Bacteroidota bacterium]
MKLNKYINLKAFAVSAVALAFVAGLTSCEDVPNSPGFEFMPDMYRTRGLRYYNEYVTATGDTLKAARLPVAGTIARDYLPSIPKGMTYEMADNLKNPIPFSPAVEKEGEVIYGKFCVHCHGDGGHGDGKVGLKMPGQPPAYDGGTLKNLSEGKIFYSISKGKNAMGPHELMLNADERWKLVHYVQKLQGVRNAPPAADSVAVVTPAGEVKKEEAKH